MEEGELLSRIADGKRLLGMFEEVRSDYEFSSSHWDSDRYKRVFAHMQQMIQKEIDDNRLKLCALRGE